MGLRGGGKFDIIFCTGFKGRSSPSLKAKVSTANSGAYEGGGWGHPYMAVVAHI